MHTLDQPCADTLARLALNGLQREYPNHLMHLLNGEEDVRRPRQLHPAFYGCYDWHSSVQSYPIRVGTHFNTAFSLLLAWDYAEAPGDARLRACLEEAALRYYREDADAPAHIEPSGDDFLSGTLTEAALMARILVPAAFDA